MSTGKTQFLSAQVEAILDHFGWEPGSPTAPVTVCSLTKAAAHEIAGRITKLPKAQVGTLHALALHSLGEKLDVAEGKERAKEWNGKFPGYAITARKRRTDGWDEQEGKAPGDAVKAKMDLLRHRMVDRAIWPVDVRVFAEKWDEWVASDAIVDFSGMIERALEESPFAPGNPKVMIYDELQDFSKLEIELAMKWTRAAGCAFFAGDPRQTIYEWRGAAPDIFDRSIPDRTRVLGKSWRVSRAVLAASQIWASKLSKWSKIDYQARNAEGFAKEAISSFSRPEEIVELAAKLTSLDEKCESCNGAGRFPTGAECRSCSGIGHRRPTAMFCAGCNYMLGNLIREMRAQGVPFSNPCAAENGKWNPLAAGKTASRISAFLKPDPATHESRISGPGPHILERDSCPPWTTRELLSWMSILRSEGTLIRGGKTRIEEMARSEDPVATSDILSQLDPAAIDRLAEAIVWAETARDHEGTKTMLRWLRDNVGAKMLERIAYPLAIAAKRGGRALLEHPRVFVGTIHSFKGAEADYVFLSPDLSMAGMDEWIGNDRQRDAVIRLFYVALTRARKGVFLCQPSDRRRNVFDELEEAFISAGRKIKGGSECPF